MNLRASVTRMLETARPTLRRFWVAVMLCVALTLILSRALTRDFHDTDRLMKVSMAFIPGILVAWCAVLYWERRHVYTGSEYGIPPRADESSSGSPELAANLIALPLAGLFVAATYLLLRDLGMVSMSRHLAICLVLSLTCFIIPHVRREGSLEMYVVKLFSHAVVSALFAAIMFFGLSAITLTVSSLFSLNVTYRAYIRIFLWMAVTLAPFLFMAGIPIGTIRSDSEDYPKVLKNLVLFVVAPLISAYTFVLYVYFAKILITREWPVGLVAHLVLWYSMVGAAILYFIRPLAGDNKWGHAFSAHFPKAVIPLTMMMFASVGIRVRHYGITENRYYVLVFGAWVLGAMIYLILARPRKSLVLPVSLAVVIALAVLGPWSSFSVSKWSQNRRLEALLTKYGMLQDGSIVHPAEPVPAEDRREFAEILFYFSKNHRLGDVRFLPRDFRFDEFEKVFGFQYYDVGFPLPHDGVFPKSHKYVKYHSEGQVLDISVYDMLFDFSLELSRGPVVSLSQGPVEVLYNRETWDVQVITEGSSQWRKSLSEYIRELAAKYGDAVDVEFSAEDMVIIDESESLRVKLVITSLWGDISEPAGERPIAGNLLFYLLVGAK